MTGGGARRRPPRRRRDVLAAALVLTLAACGGAEAPAPAEGEPAAAPAASPARPVAAAATVSFTEGPTVDEAGAVYFTDLRVNGRILKMDPDATVSTFREPSNGANGLIFDSEWRLLAAEAGNGADIPPRISRTTIETGEVEVLADAVEGKGLHRPNDLTIDGQGRVYFTDRPNLGVPPDPDKTNVHGVYRIDPDGTVARILTEPEVVRPNGIVISPDDTTLYVIETEQQEGGARMIRAFDLAPDGAASNSRVFYDFYPGRGGDGMTIDSDGNLYVAAGLNRLRGTSETLDTVAGIHVLSPSGELIEHIPIPEDTITNAAFGGDDLRTLYVTAGKTLFSVRTDITGTRR